MTDDVVAELDAELALIEQLPYRVPIHLLAKQARDEIVRLQKLTDGDWVWKQITDTRDAALEEAARLHENINAACDHERQHGAPGAGAMGAVIEYRDAIRALKEKGND